MATPPVPPTTSSFSSWDDLTVALELHNAPRPLLLSVQLWSPHLFEGSAPLASGEAHLAGVDGAYFKEMSLDGIEELPELRLKFTFEVVDPAGRAKVTQEHVAVT